MRRFQPTQRKVKNVTKWRHYWIGQSQPPATTAYAAGTVHATELWQTHTIKYEIIESKFDLHHKLHNKWKTYVPYVSSVTFFTLISSDSVDWLHGYPDCFTLCLCFSFFFLVFSYRYFLRFSLFLFQVSYLSHNRMFLDFFYFLVPFKTFLVFL